MYSHILSASFRMKSPDVSLVEWKDFKISPVEMGSFANPNQIDVIKKKNGESLPEFESRYGSKETTLNSLL